MDEEIITVEEPKEKKPRAPKMFEMRLKRNYRPMSDFKVVEYATDEDGNETRRERDPEGKPERTDDSGHILRPATDEIAKVRKGASIMVPAEEGKHIVKNRIGERADDFA